MLTSIRNWVGPGSFAPNPLKISPKTGTTLIKRKIVMPMATQETAVGYIIADLIFLFMRARDSKKVATRDMISASKPPFSPASTIETKRRSNTFGCFIRELEKLSPPSTREVTSRMTSFITLFSLWSPRVWSVDTTEMPASTMVANWRVKTTRSASGTEPLPVRAFLTVFSWMETTKRLRLSSAAVACSMVAASTEFLISFPVAASRAT